MSKRAVVTAVLAGALAALMLLRKRRPRVWIGLHLEDGMLLTLGPDEPEAPALRAGAGELIRELRPLPHGAGTQPGVPQAADTAVS